MILTQLPDVDPQSPRNAEFRRWFYARWGKENSVICGRARRAEYRPYRQTLSIKTASHGREHYFVDGRRMTVSDETYLVLNEARTYSSLIDCAHEAYSFCIFFRPGMAEEIAAAARLDLRGALDADGEPRSTPVEFAETLRRHDKRITPTLRFIQRHVASGVTEPQWVEEQFSFLLSRLLEQESGVQRLADRIDCVDGARRRELVRRIGWATDFMHSNLHREMALADIAQAARLSQFHFLRVFRQVYGVTPFAYLRAQRTERALLLLRSTTLDIGEVAGQVGLTRLALWRHMRNARGASPRRVRKELDPCFVS